MIRLFCGAIVVVLVILVSIACVPEAGTTATPTDTLATQAEILTQTPPSVAAKEVAPEPTSLPTVTISPPGDGRGLANPTPNPASTPTTLPSGLQYIDLVVGTGEPARVGATVVLSNTRWLVDGTKRDPQEFSFVLGQEEIIKGFNEGVASMRVGGKRKLTIPPELGYGDRGAGQVIPPGATLVYEVELLEVRLQALAQSKSTLVMPSDLQIEDLKVGTGDPARTGATLSVHYTGWLMDGSKFDSSLDRGRPFDFVLGQGRVIKGWDEGIASMRVGGKRRLTIPPELGYGDRGAGQVIPPGATLVFEVELLEVRSPILDTTGSPSPPGGAIRHEIMATRNHLSEAQSVEYNSIPATSGDHWPRWSQCGFFEEALPDERTVHNLEHSNIIVSYNLTTPEEVDELRDVMGSVGLAGVLGVTRFYDKIQPGTVALSAWGVSDTMQGIDEERINTFFRTYGGNLGPEGNISCLNSGVMPLGSPEERSGGQ